MVSLDDPLNFTTNEESLVDTIRSSVTSPEEEVMSMQGIQFVRKIIDEAVKDPINLEIFKRLEGIDRKQQEPETICSELGITKWKVVEGKRKALQQIHSAFFREQVTLSELYDLKTTLDPIPTLISLLKR
jgi:hypothetical protein